MKRLFLLIAFLFTCSISSLWCQTVTDTTKGILMPAKVENGDTIVLANLDEITIPTPYIKPVFENKREERRYSRLIYNIKKVYPYAKMARDKLLEMNEHYKTLNTERERKEYAKQVEKEIRDKYEDQLKDLTRTQGLLLIKLIDRETGKVSYELVREFRGNVSAFFWQTLARIFGLNLKTKYDPMGEDRAIEDILVAIDAGLI
ncbi:MAG TPA: DUF4294 domain-containing protein [Bacteroidales bacterium]